MARLEMGEKPFFRDELEIFKEEGSFSGKVKVGVTWRELQDDVLLQEDAVRRIVRDELEKIRSEGRS